MMREVGLNFFSVPHSPAPVRRGQCYGLGLLHVKLLRFLSFSVSRYQSNPLLCWGGLIMYCMMIDVGPFFSGLHSSMPVTRSEITDFDFFYV